MAGDAMSSGDKKKVGFLFFLNLWYATFNYVHVCYDSIYN